MPTILLWNLHLVLGKSEFQLVSLGKEPRSSEPQNHERHQDQIPFWNRRTVSERLHFDEVKVRGASADPQRPTK
jgi:hypothetical protein